MTDARAAAPASKPTSNAPVPGYAPVFDEAGDLKEKAAWISNLLDQVQFKEHGIRVTIRQVSDTTAEMEGSNWDIGVVSNGTVSFGGNPIPPLQRYYRTGGNRNYSHLSDPELDALIDELAVTFPRA